MSDNITDDLVDMDELKQMTLELVWEKLAETLTLSNQLVHEGNLNLELIARMGANGIVYTLKKSLLRSHPYKRKSVACKVPATKMSALLDLCLPQWMRRFRKRIKYNSVDVEVTVYNVCPHHNIPVDSAQYRHVHYAFLKQQPWDDCFNNYGRG